MDALRKAALAYPETREDHPWGEMAIEVKRKVLKKKFAEPTHYGLGKHGWLSCAFAKDTDSQLEE